MPETGNRLGVRVSKKGERNGEKTGEKKRLLRNAIRCVVGASVALLLSGPAFAQYGGMGSGSPGYGSGKAVGIGVGAAAAGAAVLYFALHHGSSVTGCVQSSDDGLRLVDAKSKKTYSLLPGGADVKVGEQVELSGKKSKAANGDETFQAKKMVKNLGACGAISASAANSVRSTSLQPPRNSPPW